MTWLIQFRLRGDRKHTEFYWLNLISNREHKCLQFNIKISYDQYIKTTVAQGFGWSRYMVGDNKEKTVALLKGMKEFADEIGYTQAQLALAWVLVNKDVSTCIIGATKMSQVEDNLGALKLASSWTKEYEDRMIAILGNEPIPRLNFLKFMPDKPRRPFRVTYSLKLGKVDKTHD